MNEDVIYLILSIVQEIPYGQVASYKQIATLAGMPKNPVFRSYHYIF